jgi:hypothetical protein
MNCVCIYFKKLDCAFSYRHTTGNRENLTVPSRMWIRNIYTIYRYAASVCLLAAVLRFHMSFSAERNFILFIFIYFHLPYNLGSAKATIFTSSSEHRCQSACQQMSHTQSAERVVQELSLCGSERINNKKTDRFNICFL